VNGKLVTKANYDYYRNLLSVSSQYGEKNYSPPYGKKALIKILKHPVFLQELGRQSFPGMDEK